VAESTPGVGDYEVTAITSNNSRVTHGVINPEGSFFQADRSPGVGEYELTGITSKIPRVTLGLINPEGH